MSGAGEDSSPRPTVVVVGGGFGGLACVRSLARAPVDVVLVDRRNHHLFQPLLYQVATAALPASYVATPIRRILRRQANARVLLGDVVDVDLQGKRLCLAEGELAYDHLVLAAGLTHTYFGHDDWAAHAPGLKTLEDALAMRRRVLYAFEEAERAQDEAAQTRWLTFAVVGAGPTGVEIAGALREIATRSLARDFRRIDPRRARVVLIEAAGRVLPSFPADLSRRAVAQLERLGVELRLGTRVTEIDSAGVELGDERIEAGLAIWSAGVRGVPLAARLGLELSPDGRVPVEPDLTLPGHPEVAVIGDLARVMQDGAEVPAMAQGALQMGRHVARDIARVLAGGARTPFRFQDKGVMATVGRAAAVARVGRVHFGGLFAWLLWLFVHLLWLVGFRNKLATLFEWTWAYVTWQRSARVVVDLAAGAPAPAADPVAASLHSGQAGGAPPGSSSSREPRAP